MLDGIKSLDINSVLAGITVGVNDFETPEAKKHILRKPIKP